ncbi:MAG: signal recognition particle receptor subunit alpha, partial [Actinomycetota bacterium]|nr:signal recognition particle receptor subunit alpha [Actinomycetota bacterium]
MSSTVIVIVVVAVVVLVAALVIGVMLSKRRRISLGETKPEIEEKAKPRGGYQTGGGISLAPGGPKAHPAGERTEVDGQPGVGDDASVPRDSDRRGIVDLDLPESTAVVPPQATGPHTDPITERIPTQAEPPTDQFPVQSRPQVPAQGSAPDVEDIAPTSGRLERLRGKLSRSRSAFGQGLLGLLGAGDLDEDSWTDVEDTLLLADLGAATTEDVVQRLRAELVKRGVRSPEQARAL